MTRIKHVFGWPIRLGGESHRGWLPPGAAQPLPIPIRNLLIDLVIEYDGAGYLLIVTAVDGSESWDTWHESLDDAESSASRWFGLGRDDWIHNEPNSDTPRHDA